MNATEPSQEHFIEAMHIFAAAKMKSGASSSQVQAMLVEKGLSQETAANIISNTLRLRSEAMHKNGKKNIFYGALWLIGGVVVTNGSHGIAVANGGGHYVVAWGAIVFGIIQIFKGLAQAGVGGAQMLIRKVYGLFGSQFSRH